MRDQEIGHERIEDDHRGGIDEIEGRAARQQKPDMQVLLGQNLENDADRDDRHDRDGHDPEFRPEQDVGDVGRDRRKPEARRQRDGEQKFDAVIEMCARRFPPAVSENLHGQRNESGRGTHRRDDQRLAHQIDPCAVLPRIGRAGEIGDDETVDHVRDRQERHRYRQRDAGFCDPFEPRAIEADGGACPGLATSPGH